MSTDKELKAQIERINAMLQAGEDHLLSLTVKTEFVHGNMGMARAGKGWELQWHGRSVHKVRMDDKIDAALALGEFSERYVAELNRLLNKAKEVR